MEAYISDETIARCRAMLDTLPPHPRSLTSWSSGPTPYETLTQLTLLSQDGTFSNEFEDTLSRGDRAVDTYGMINA